MVINLKNKIWIILVILFIIGICGGFYIFSKNTNNKDNQNNYNSTKTSTNQLDNNENTSAKNSIIENKVLEKNTINTTQNSTGSEQKIEEEISSFSTKVYDQNSSRQNNLSITCSTLNGTIVTKGSTFSFCNTFGPATPEQGYEKADTFDKNGNKVKEFGGGKCQVSTTLYNAILKVPNLVVTERHPHSNKVPYIEDGKDAAVSYGSYDLKFINDTGFDIKISAVNNANSVIITLYKLI